MLKKVWREATKGVHKITGHEHRKNKRRARQVQVIRQQNEHVQVFTVTLQTEEEVPDVVNPQELDECPADQHCWKPIESAVTIESNGTQIAVTGNICIHCLRMKE